MATFASLPPGAQAIIAKIAEFLHFPVENFPGGPGDFVAPAGGAPASAGIAPSGSLAHSADVAPTGGLAPSGGPVFDAGAGANAGDDLLFPTNAAGSAMTDEIKHAPDLPQLGVHHELVAPAGFEDILAALNNAAHWDFM
jgi:hypothetical protein